MLAFLTLWKWISYRGKSKYIRWSEEQYTLLWCLIFASVFYFRWDLAILSFQLLPESAWNHYSFTQSHWSIFWVKPVQNNVVSHISKTFSFAKNIYYPNIQGVLILQSKVYDSYLTKSKPLVYLVDHKGKNILVNDHQTKFRFWQPRCDNSP